MSTRPVDPEREIYLDLGRQHGDRQFILKFMDPDKIRQAIGKLYSEGDAKHSHAQRLADWATNAFPNKDFGGRRVVFD